jgi:SAM-dependent methyltransferase
MNQDRPSLASRLLRKLGYRDSEWGDWRGLDSEEQAPRYDLIESWRTMNKPSGSILDLGCGEGLVLDRIHQSPSPAMTYCGIDRSAKAIEIARSKIRRPNVEKFICGDIRDFSLAENDLFDLILFNEVLYYLPNPNKDPVDVVRQYEKLHLKEGGLIMVSVWHDKLNRKEKNELTWRRISESYGGGQCLCRSSVRKGSSGEWKLGLYLPRRDE